jgi:predicted Zn-dependent peptidase
MTCAFAAAQTTDALRVKQLKLSNGMTVWLNEDHSLPRVYGAVVVLAGAKDCPNTGIAHYFEHIMFKGTDNIGTTDYAKEKVWLDSIAAQYDVLSRTKGKPQRDSLQLIINRLSLHAADYAIPNEFSRLISKYGGSALNASTSYDYTEFHNTFAPQFITQWAWLNSERLLHPVFRLFQSELETVYEEKNRAADNMYYECFDRAMSSFCTGHPYAYPILGSTENLKNPKLSEMQTFFRKYYVANNMGLILTGDISADSIMPLLERTFGRLPQGDIISRTAQTLRPFNGLEKVKIKIPLPIVKGELDAFRAPKDADSDADALDLAVSLLSNDNHTGLLDSLVTADKVMLAEAIRESLNDGGLVGFGFIPRLIFGSRSKAHRIVWDQGEQN